MPYWRLSSFYFFYFASLGIIVPYWGLYLKSIGLDAPAIGSLMAILMITKIISPNILGWLGDHWQNKMQMVRLASLFTLISFILILKASDFIAIALITALYSFFWNASLPLFESITFNYLGQNSHFYGRIRLWGSIGFICSVILVGQWIEISGPSVVLWSLALVFAAILCSSLSLNEKKSPIQPTDPVSLKRILSQPPVYFFFIAVFLMQMSHGSYYAFYTLYLQDHGYSKVQIAWLWSLGVFAEVSLFLIIHRYLARWGSAFILMISLFLAALRWLLIGYGVNIMILLALAQCLHAASFGSFHAAAMQWVHAFFQGQHQAKGQALYNSVSFGAGGAAGSLLSGLLWPIWEPSSVYALSALLALSAGLFVASKLLKISLSSFQQSS